MARFFNGREFVLAVGDASTKGARGRLHASVLKQSLYAAIAYESRPSQMLSVVARSFLDAIDASAPSEIFATLFIASIDTQHGTLTFASGGTEGGLVLDAQGSYEQLEATGPLIGLEAKASFGQRTIDFNHGQRIFAYSDGITEARSALTGEPFGLRRLALVAKRCICEETQAVPGIILAELDDFTGGLYHDDATFAAATSELGNDARSRTQCR